MLFTNCFHYPQVQFGQNLESKIIKTWSLKQFHKIHLFRLRELLSVELKLCLYSNDRKYLKLGLSFYRIAWILQFKRKTAIYAFQCKRLHMLFNEKDCICFSMQKTAYYAFQCKRLHMLFNAISGIRGYWVRVISMKVPWMNEEDIKGIY